MQGLKMAVIVMGVLIVLGVGVIIATILRRTVLAPVPVSLEFVLDEPDGTHIAGISGQADRLAVQLQGGGPDRVVIYDLRAGKVAGRVSLSHQRGVPVAP
jgi:hypothetical protein